MDWNRSTDLFFPDQLPPCHSLVDVCDLTGDFLNCWSHSVPSPHWCLTNGVLFHFYILNHNSSNVLYSLRLTEEVLYYYFQPWFPRIHLSRPRNVGTKLIYSPCMTSQDIFLQRYAVEAGSEPKSGFLKYTEVLHKETLYICIIILHISIR